MVALQTSAEKPAPVRVISQAIGGWIGRLGAVWVEGQVTQLTRRSGTQTAFLTLRDPAADLSLQVTCPHQVLEQVQPPIVEGARVVVHAKPAWYYARGTLSLAADEIRPIGLGELLARIERLRGVLAAEGLFAPERKRQLPFLPRVVGLVCGRGSAAEHDVLQNARRRWPAIQFRVLEVAVQGPSAVLQVVDAVRTLDRDAEVDVIVLARGGGSVEDLLPFSDETLVRAVASARTPVVSAIGHEGDAPLVDFVADVRASTPTDAAKRIVPDADEEIERVRRAHERLRAALRYRLDRDQAALAAMIAAGPGGPDRRLTATHRPDRGPEGAIPAMFAAQPRPRCDGGRTHPSPRADIVSGCDVGPRLCRGSAPRRCRRASAGRGSRR